ncbi:MAG: acyloxyacyl hydrolase [Saprospiraceae bacterium]|nr:acyloxyacyl hydrolase [Saprospiraceae bacterium]MDW8229500.1 acyloxyacyl hydrolase [Saprospiraceae bacterium]
MKRHVFTGLLLASRLLCAWAQTPNAVCNPVLIGIRAHRGFIIPHSRELINVSKTKPRGVEVNVQWIESRPERTERTGVVAKRGFVFYYFDFDNPCTLGHSVASAAYVEPMFGASRRLYASLQTGLGMAYVSRVYDAEDNPTNLFFSSHINLLAMLNVHLHYRATPRCEVTMGFNYNHISNGGMRLPNKGMNFPTWNAGMSYAIQPGVVQRAPRTGLWRTEPRHFGWVHAVGSAKTVLADGSFARGEVQWLWGAMAAVGRRVGRLSALSVGTEWIRDGWKRARLDLQGNDGSAWLGGLLFGHELLAGRVRFNVHMGAYVFNQARETDALYQRYGLFYTIGNGLLIGSTLKAHRHVADLFDVRVGWIFQNRSLQR